ncbi:MAG TPA: helix-turn-helix transcriptional regulator [Candidatus Ruthenibacterium merdavium]|uniref:Helix-turn-helix transcriptional regulator n=1 Tax=Candidatus Ruthenibacterium merdavium TaxID=2838752 RepID=A0A9D2Q7C2_9FIRM|nr:helix-turn-helix transcriptional regulator [Candidatus Ruthenibacterium merdavium]
MRIDRIKLISEMAIQEIKVGELSEKAGVSRVTISAMRSGKSCTKNSAIHVARALGVDVEELLEQPRKEQEQ